MRGSRELVPTNFMAARLDARPIFAAAASIAAAIYLAHAYRRRRRHLARCEKYALDPRYGFLPASCAATLPPAFAELEGLASMLPSLNRSRSLAAAVRSLDPVAESELEALTEREVRRLYVLLSAVAHSYVNGALVPWEFFNEVELHAGMANPSAEPAAELPRVISAPWLHACERLGLPPVYVATGMDLWNHTLELPTAPWFWPEPAALLDAFGLRIATTGGAAEVAFHAVPFAIQVQLAHLLPALIDAPADVARRRWRTLAALCGEIAAALRRCLSLLQQVAPRLDPAEFYDVYRPLLGGWDAHGLVLRGTGTTTRAKGPSAGQTALLILLDVVLGVAHKEETRAFQLEMRTGYLPRPHRVLLEDVAADVARSGSLRAAAADAAAPAALRDAHCRAIDALAAFRSFHLGMATKYLRRTDKGTGASDFRSMLKEAVESTREGRVR